MHAHKHTSHRTVNAHDTFSHWGWDEAFLHTAEPGVGEGNTWWREGMGVYVTSVGPVTRWSTLEWSDSSHIPSHLQHHDKESCTATRRNPKGKAGGGGLSGTMLADGWLFQPPFKFSGATCPFINNWTGTLVWPHGTGQRVSVLTQPLRQCCWWHTYL